MQRMVGIASLACALSLALVYVVARPAVELLAVAWAEMLADALVPMLVTFAILYRSDARREMSGLARSGYLFWVSGLIFVAVSCALVTLVFLACIFARLGAQH